MNNVISPLLFGSQSQAVADLQAALISLKFDQLDQQEIQEQRFGETTCSMLKNFMTANQLIIFPLMVDEVAAEHLNDVLKRANIQETILPPLFSGSKSAEVFRMQIGLKQMGFPIDTQEIEGQLYGDKTTAILGSLTQFNAFPKCWLNLDTANKINLLISQLEPVPPPVDPPSGNIYVVSGAVLNAFNETIPGQKLVAYDLDLKGIGYYKKIDNVNGQWFGEGMQKLGEETISGIDGNYVITFHESDFADAEEDMPDVVVFAISGDGFLIGRSRLSTRTDFTGKIALANWNVQINARAMRGETEYSKLLQAVNPFMDKSKLALHEVAGSADQLEFIASETEQDLASVTQLAMANALLNGSMDLQVLANQMVDKPMELLYGLARQSVKMEWETISKIPVTNMAAFIKQSADANIIRIIEGDGLGFFAGQLHGIAIQKTLDNSTSLQNGIKKILNIAVKDDVAMHRFYASYVNRTGTPKEFWATLRQDPNLKDAVAPLLLTNTLSALSGNNMPLMQKLMEKTNNNDVKSLQDLSIQDWNEAIGNDVPGFIPGTTPKEKQNNYREYMRGLLNAAHPNEKVSMMVKTQEESGIQDSAVRDALNEFLTSTGFDLRLNRLTDRPDPASDTFQTRLDAISGERKADVKKALNRVQRVFQFSPSPDIMTKLLQRGIDSATMVASMPYNTFKTNYKDVGDEPVLLAIHQRASHIVSMIEYSILSLNRFSQSAAIPAITGQINS
ncbi:MAG: hypothetical protein ABI416_04905 [Ginsengibacter sp.]